MMIKLMMTLAFAVLTACQPLSCAGIGEQPPAAVDAQNAPQSPQSPPQTPPQSPPVEDADDNDQEIVQPQDVPADAPKPQIPAEVNDLLDRLETSAADLRAFTADIRYEKEDALLGRKELRAGELIFSQDPETGDKSFAILFERTIIDGVQRGEPRHYIFSGRWLAEIDHNNRQFIKREIVPPGRTLDPLKLGEGPFPLPIGQPKSEVLARFDVTRAAIPDQGLLRDLDNVETLSLKPKPNTREAREYAKVDLYYDRQTLLPIGIVVVDKGGDQKTVRLLNAKRNPELTPEQTARLDIREPDPRQWRIDVQPWTQRD